MAENQTDTNNSPVPPGDDSNAGEIEEPAQPIPDRPSEAAVAANNDQFEDQGTAASTTSDTRSAADNYNELASKVFESPQEDADDEGHVTDTVPADNQAVVETEDGNVEAIKTEADFQKTTTEQGSLKGDNAVEVVTNQEQSDEDPSGTSAKIENKSDQNVDKLPEINSEQVHEQTNLMTDVNTQTADQTELNSDKLKSGSVSGFNEEEIIHRLQEVNQEVYNNDESFQTESETLVQTKDDQTDVPSIQDANALDSSKSAEKPEGLGLDGSGDTDKPSGIRGEDQVLSGDGDAEQVVSDEVTSTARKGSITESGGGDASTLPNNTTDISEMGSDARLPSADEVIGNVQSREVSADSDAEQMEQAFGDFAKQEDLSHQAAMMQPQEAAISTGQSQQQRDEQHRVTYADLPTQEGALTSSHQVLVSKRPRGQVALIHHTHHQRGPLPQTAPSRLSQSTTKSVHIPKIPSPPASAHGERTATMRNSQKLPPSLMRMSTVMGTARKRAILNRQASTYFEEKQTTKLVTLDQCINSRPPLPFDLDGPGPWHYSPTNKPLYETNAPEYSIACKIYERGGGGRTAWAKSWFNSPDNFTRKVRWEKSWPSPTHYSPRSPILGRPQASRHSYPSFSIGVRSDFSINKRGSENEPAPCQYNRDKADHLIMRSAPSFSIAHRNQETTLGKLIEKTPSPDAYRPKHKHMSSHVHYPSFTIRGIRKEKIHALGPHSTL